MIAQKIASVLERIEAAKQRAGRADEVSLVAVTKKADVPRINQAIKAGVKIIGENRVQAAAEKFPDIMPVERHMIGHLQTNKVRHAVRLFDCIQSVDTLKVAREIDRRTARLMPVFIEVNISGEEQKYGIEPEDVAAFYDKILKLTNLKVQGLMAIAPYVEAEQTRPYFAKMKKLNDELGLRFLSMGMTNDFEVAVEEGSNMVRVGTAIF
jgi:hypothetical protein